jgi:hypothetical protein
MGLVLVVPIARHLLVVLIKLVMALLVLIAPLSPILYDAALPVKARIATAVAVS